MDRGLGNPLRKQVGRALHGMPFIVERMVAGCLSRIDEVGQPIQTV